MSREEREKRRKSAYRNSWLIVAVVVCILAGLIGGGVTLAKYYEQESRKGVSVASGLYFTSNCLMSISNNDIGDFGKFTQYAGSGGWNGSGACTLPIQINNFENILLYNDRNLNIMYDLYFQLLDTPVEGSSYEVRYTIDGVTQTKKLAENAPFVIKDQYLQGGSAQSNRVDLIVSPEADINAEKYISKRVAAWAVPTYPDYVANTSKLAAVITAVPQKGEFSHRAGFEIAEDLDAREWNPDGIRLLNNYSGFVYNIKTTGEDRYATHYFEISWDNRYLDIDQYNSYYLEAIKSTDTSWKDDTAHTSTIKVEAPSYTSMNIHFYKTENFKPETLGSAKAFNGLVTVTDVRELINP